MRILVLNSGSSSIKFSVFTCAGDARLGLEREGELTGIGSKLAALKGSGGEETPVQAKSLTQAISVVLDALSKSSAELIDTQIDAVGYRVVHPGAELHQHQRITPEVLRLLDEAAHFAPLHDPEAVMLIRATMHHYPQAAHFACFDTVFHETMPAEAQTYPLPETYRERGVHRYGFHGLSCESIVRQMRAAGALPRRMVIAHLGSGCSLTALLDGRSVDNTMGLTPTGGVVMGTRSGDLDPGLVVYLMRQQRGSREQAIAAVETLLNHGSGIDALSGLPNDMRLIRAAAADGNGHARLALKVFTRSITKAIGAFCWLLGGLDAIVFTGGIGEHDAQTRSGVLAGAAEMGIVLAPAAPLTGTMQRISSTASRTQVFTAPAQEEQMIALHVQQLSQADHARPQPTHQEEAA